MNQNEILALLSPEDAAAVLARLCQDAPDIAKQAAALADEILGASADVDGVAADVQMELDFLDVEDLWAGPADNGTVTMDLAERHSTCAKRRCSRCFSSGFDKLCLRPPSRRICQQGPDDPRTLGGERRPGGMSPARGLGVDVTFNVDAGRRQEHVAAQVDGPDAKLTTTVKAAPGQARRDQDGHSAFGIAGRFGEGSNLLREHRGTVLDPQMLGLPWQRDECAPVVAADRTDKLVPVKAGSTECT